MRSRAACAGGPGYGDDGAPVNMLDPALVPWALELGTPAGRRHQVASAGDPEALTPSVTGRPPVHSAGQGGQTGPRGPADRASDSMCD